jgi:dethiobiotin synthetase
LISGQTRRIVVVGTGTAVGKTHVACALIRAWGERGVRAVGLKPVETGVSPGGSGSEGSSDQERLCSASAVFHVKRSIPPEFHVKQSLYAFPQAVSPHLAARTAGLRIDLGSIRHWVAEQNAPIVVVETAGGLFSPLGPGLTNLDLAKALRPNVLVLVAADRLGVLHDVTAALGLASARGCNVDATVLCASQPADLSTGTNAAELARLDLVHPLSSFPRASDEHPTSLAAADRVILGLPAEA